jgi:selenocysteine-specific elongation factor
MGGGNKGNASDAGVALPKDPNRILNINVGVLGHVDSGKTSLVKTLSTYLSTASLDKSAQSRQRGITLDLGFSAFVIHDLPPQIPAEQFDCLQVTLVDCPGHASLIRTIIGGAQIIDFVLLVIDATKGIQTQTAECIVIAEMTTRNLIVVLNKTDMFPEAEREERLKAVQKRIRAALQPTRFKDAPMVPVAAAIGGEKVAALNMTKAGQQQLAAQASSSSSSNSKGGSALLPKLESSNIVQLVETLKTQMALPQRSHQRDAFYFAIDHCFPIKGQGTVITGTVLSGALQSNDTVAFPEHGLERKVKSIQMFKRQVTGVKQGDRCGMCLASLDSKLIERGIAATPGSVSLISSVICIVKKVKFFRGTLVSDSKFHISIGHTTVMATVKFFGAKELDQRLLKEEINIGEEDAVVEHSDNAQNGDSAVADGETTTTTTAANKAARKGGKGSAVAGASSADVSASLGGSSISGLPRIPFDFDESYVFQEKLVEDLESWKDSTGPTPAGVTGKIPATGTTDSTPDLVAEQGNGVDGGGAGVAAATQHQSSASISSLSKDTPLHWAIVELQTPVYCPLNSLLIGSRLDTEIQANTCRLAFSGRLIQKFDQKVDAPRLKIYNWKEKRGVLQRMGDPHRRDDDQRVVRYEVFGSNLFKKETNMQQFVGLKVQTEPAGDIGYIHSSFGTSGKFKVMFPSGTEAKEGSSLILRFKRYMNDPQKGMHQDHLELPAARPGTQMEIVKKTKKKANKAPKPQVLAEGVLSKYKQDSKMEGEDGKYGIAIIEGFFTPEINIKDEKVGMKVVIPETKEEGTITGSFGKMGKCKVTFEQGVTAPEGSKAQLLG